jgi:hypothetical protein
MSIPRKDIVKLELRDEIKQHLEGIIELNDKIKKHELALSFGDWFNLKAFCTNYCPDLEDLYKKSNDICGWEK